MFKKTKVLGTGMALPEKIVTNFDLEKLVETTDQWIFERTGIRERRISSTEGGEFPSDLGVKASLQALEKAGLEPNDIDMILVSSVTPDYKLPNTAAVIQQKLGITNNCTCLDISAACSGFVYGANMADSMIKTGMFKNILVIGTEMLSRETDWTDRSMCILFGDAAGAAILGSSSDKDDTSEFLSGCLGTDGSGERFFYQHIGGAAQPIEHHHLEENTHFMQMKGTEMFKVATRTLAQSAKKVVADAGLTLEDVDWLVPHQANIRIIETTGKLLGIDPNKVIVNIHKYGNTSAATIPVAFHEAIEDGRIKRGDIVLFDAFGAGLTYGATLLRY
jgi:3-oxoacyl-[acyl-carrier-protein] synthase-3